MRTRPTGSPFPRRAAVAAALAAMLSAGLTACGGDDEGTARDEGTSPTVSPSSDASSTSTATPGSYPSFAPTDYVYRLEVICFCPQVGAVRVQVTDGEVVSARTLGSGRGVTKGAEAPEFARLTINEIIDVANTPGADSVEVTWPDGQDYPSVVEVDRMAEATDDEVTYTIKNVRVR